MSSFYRREKGAFFSYSHADRDLAVFIVDWLREKAQIDPWIDIKDLDAGAPVLGKLSQSIRKCRSLILLLTPASLRSAWVPQEWKVATEETGKNPGFKRLALVHGNVDPDEIPASLDSDARINLPEQGLDGQTASQLLSSLRLGSGEDQTNWDVFLTRTWREEEDASKFADMVCQQLDKEEFRLIGDEPRKDSDPDRLRAIIASCRVHVAMVPPREPAELIWLLDDIAIARECGLPTIVLVDPQVVSVKTQLETSDGSSVNLDHCADVIEVPMGRGVQYAEVKDQLKRVINRVEDYRDAHSPDPYSVVFASDPTRASREERQDIDRVVGRITGRKCIFPNQLQGQQIQSKLTHEARDAVTLIADVSDEDIQTWVLAGIARGAGRPVSLVSGSDARLPLVFQDSPPRLYESDADRIGLVHSAVFPYRRWFMNEEISPWT
jgi:hypothetical protein